MVLSTSRIAIFIAAWLLLNPAGAWAIPPPYQYVPVERLLRNVSAYVKTHPKDAEGHFLLGRLHASAFLFDLKKELPVAATEKSGDRYIYADKNSETQRPLLLHRGPSLMRREQNGVSEVDTREFAASVREYQLAIALGSDEPTGIGWKAPSNRLLSYLGLAWMIEQGTPYRYQLGVPPAVDGKANTMEGWTEQALAAYRRCYALSGNQESGDPDGRLAPRFECGDAIVRILKKKIPAEQPGIWTWLVGKDPYRAERRELARLEKAMSGPRGIAISPIVFSLAGPASLSSLLAPELDVKFNLDGSGLASRWPWVKPDTGILVWDPQHTGAITSGTQLFGSVTWWLFWSNGYQPLAALDDDGDGWLSDRELNGIAVWRDKNQNGVADPGEVNPATAWGIRRIAVRPYGAMAGSLYHPFGIQFQDGSSVATYDWVPVEKTKGR
jgi:hypothetical protein